MLGSGLHGKGYEKRCFSYHEGAATRHSFWGCAFFRDEGSATGADTLSRWGKATKKARQRGGQVLLAFLFAFLFPRFAFALSPNDYQIIYGPLDFQFPDYTEREIGVIAPNRYDAVLVALDSFYLKPQITADMFAKLSNESTGGNFYKLAQEFETPEPEGSIFNPGFWTTAIGLYGADNCWYAECDLSLFSLAKQDLETILNGGDLEGDVANQVLQKDLDLYGVIGDKGLSGGSVIGDVLSISFSNAYYSQLLSSFNKKDLTYAISFLYYGVDSNSSSSYFEVYASSSPITYSYKEYSSTNIGNNTYTIYELTIESSTNLFLGNNALNSSTFNDTNTNKKVFYRYHNGVAYRKIIGFYSSVLFAGPPPPTQWPEDPEPDPPTPPEVPDPEPPSEPEEPVYGTPELPNPGGPTFPTQDPDPTDPTFTVDLQGVLDAMAAHCKHIRDAMYSNVSDLYTALSGDLDLEFSATRELMASVCNSINDNLSDQFSWLGGYVHQDIVWLANYLKSLAEWLASQLSFDVSSPAYDDSSVVSWLKKIWSKLGSGVRARPVDPVSDPVGTGSWLETLIRNLITALTDLFPDIFSGLSDGVEALTKKFPFSVPWDIAAVLVLLVAPAETPEFDVPVFAVQRDGSIENVGDYHLSLQFLDDVMPAVRLMFEIAWAVYLLVHVKDLMMVIENPVKGY